MAFIPKIPARFIKPIVKNVITILENNIPDALQWIADEDDSDVLPPFEAYNNSPRLDTNFPVLTAEPGDSDLAEEDAIAGVHNVDIEIAVTGDDPDQLTLDVIDYVTAIDLVLRNVEPMEFLEGYEKHGSPIANVTNHAYSIVGRNDAGIYLRRARLTLQVGYLTTR